MGKVTNSDVVINKDGSVMLKSYKIPFRPEYILVPESNENFCLDSFKPLHEISGRDLPAFRFRLSAEAIELIRLQDSNVTRDGGYCSLLVKFDVMSPEYATIEATRAVRKSELAGA